ncbi:MAG: ImmA/IrrE family metallo-endopeptidase [Defluviitaleaceae bacterium]|nr:ImmA/IrrE family metallo-endopeptidase [Defluviitaleaceae bacterium]
MTNDSAKSGHRPNDKVVSAFNIMVNEINSDGILDHEVRAIETLMANKKQSEYRGQQRIYKIIKHQNCSIDSPHKGFAFVHPWGATIIYSPHGTRLQKMIVIGHELGHIFLEHIGLGDKRGNTSYDRLDPKQEEEAFKFSGMIALRRSKQYRDNNFLEPRRYTSKQVDDAICDIYSNYKGTPI